MCTLDKGVLRIGKGFSVACRNPAPARRKGLAARLAGQICSPAPTFAANKSRHGSCPAGQLIEAVGNAAGIALAGGYRATAPAAAFVFLAKQAEAMRRRARGRPLSGLNRTSCNDSLMLHGNLRESVGGSGPATGGGV